MKGNDAWRITANQRSCSVVCVDSYKFWGNGALPVHCKLLQINEVSTERTQRIFTENNDGFSLKPIVRLLLILFIVKQIEKSLAFYTVIF